MTVIQWEGIPERYWPDTDTPWRVSWGFGCHEDFATREEAQAFHDEGKAEDERRGGGWDALWSEPFNAVEIDR